MNKRTATVLAGVACAGLLGTGIAAAAVVTPGDGDGVIHMCYSESSKAVPNNYVQFREENFTHCLPGYKHFEFNKQGQPGMPGVNGTNGTDGQNGVSGYETFTSVQNFSPGGIGGAWCGAPTANASDQGWRVVGGGAELAPEDVNKGVAVVSSWPNTADANNPGWNVQLNKPTNVNPGDVELYAVCVKTAGAAAE